MRCNGCTSWHLQWWIRAGRILVQQITLGGIASVWRKPELFGHVDLIIIDEVHLVSPRGNTMYQTFITALQKINPHIRVIGLTATPWRMGHGLLTDPYKVGCGRSSQCVHQTCLDITNYQSFNRLIAEGYLVDVVPEPKIGLNVDGIASSWRWIRGKDLQLAIGQVRDHCRRLQGSYRAWQGS